MVHKPRYLLDEKTGKNKQAIEDLKVDVFQHYGGVCEICGEPDMNVLTFEKLERNGLIGTLYFLRAHNYPAGRRLICANCKHKLQYS